MIYSVYVIKCNRNKRCYIGITHELIKRLRDHIRLLKTGKHYNSELQKDFDYFGETNFSVYELRKVDCASNSIALRIERDAIARFDKVYNSTNTFNLKKDGTLSKRRHRLTKTIDLEQLEPISNLITRKKVTLPANERKRIRYAEKRHERVLASLVKHFSNA